MFMEPKDSPVEIRAANMSRKMGSLPRPCLSKEENDDEDLCGIIGQLA